MAQMTPVAGPGYPKICLVLKHLGSYFVQMFIHSFALYVGEAGVTSVFLSFVDQQGALSATPGLARGGGG